MQITANEVDFCKLCCNGQYEEVKKYVEEDYEDPYVIDKEGRTGLIYAIWHNHTKIVEYLLLAAPYIEDCPTRNNLLPKRIALGNQNPEMIALFLDTIPQTDFNKALEQLLEPAAGHMPYIEVTQECIKKLNEIYLTPNSIKRREEYKDVREKIKKTQANHQAEPKPTVADFTSLHLVIRCKTGT